MKTQSDMYNHPVSYPKYEALARRFESFDAAAQFALSRGGGDVYEKLDQFTPWHLLAHLTR